MKPAGKAKASGERALAAKAPEGTPDDVLEALERLPEELQEHYIAALHAEDGKRAHFRGGQKGGGRFMPKRVTTAITVNRDIMARWPAEGQHRGRRHIKAYGLPDNEAEFRAYNSPGLHDDIVRRARKVRTLTEVSFRELRTTQSTVDGEKVEAMLQGNVSESTASPLIERSPIVVKRGNRKWLWDGHHRAAKDMLLGATGFKARFIDLDEQET